MNKTFFLAWPAVFVVWMFGSFIVHGTLLHPDYEKLPSLFRPEADAQKYVPFLMLAHVMLSGALVWIYARGVEAKPWLPQGLRFGLATALLLPAPWYTIYYAVQPMPELLVVKQIAFDGILMLLLGITVAFMYRNERRTA